MSGCLVCERTAAIGANGYCMQCWDASENFAANTYDGIGSYRDYVLGLAKARAA